MHCLGMSTENVKKRQTLQVQQGIVIQIVSTKSCQQDPSNICRSPEINSVQLNLYLENWFWFFPSVDILQTS